MDKQFHTLTLKCPSCGAALGVTPDMDRFACGYCGTEQVVQRRDGTVALKLVTDAISRVQSGTDKTAAELAIRRINDEMGDLDIRQQQINVRRARRDNGLGGLFVVAIFLFVWFLFARERAPELAWKSLIAAVATFIVACFVAAKPPPFKKEEQEIHKQRAALGKKLAHQKAIVES